MATATDTRENAKATLRFLRASPQKVRLVVDQLRGKPAPEALSLLKFSRRGVARDLHKLLRSAVANAEQHELGDMEELVVSGGWVDPGPSLKRIRPAPMGRAFRYLHRTSHVTLVVSNVENFKPGRKSGRKRR